MKNQVSLSLKRRLKAALAEDLGVQGDVTAQLLVSSSAKAQAFILARESGVFSGKQSIAELFQLADSKLKVFFFVKEGQSFRRGAKLIRLKGRAHSILKAERTALNLLGHLCGVASLTRQYVKQVKRYGVSILDTRKTTPLWRDLEKQAVKSGGGKNHRMGLYDRIFVKENHRPQGRLGRLRQVPKQFEIEVRNQRELAEALLLSPKVILLDNFSISELKKAVKWVRKSKRKVILEASGGITLGNVTKVAQTGIDWISSGALTHSVKNIDLSLIMDFK